MAKLKRRRQKGRGDGAPPPRLRARRADGYRATTINLPMELYHQMCAYQRAHVGLSLSALASDAIAKKLAEETTPAPPPAAPAGEGA